ncbi:BID domain-containing T4SS effector [Bartonella machadoae]|uniref:BID domain-containing T4SS effector n=1 Tax=Bartonella machadoae TaxID=2893471 RepID=UPI001F4D0E00|nr:BID domain-containing T4SS effector [Bartonella machadoae]UNE53789.1 BID domain-containing T4SS effector [Bartonella machadoae]
MKKHQQSPSSAVNPEDLYAQVNKPKREQHQAQTPETPYAPQYPLQGASSSSRPRRGQQREELVSPYSVSDLSKNNWRASLEEPQNWYIDREHPHKQPEHHYADLDFGGNSGRNPQRRSTHLYAEIDPRGGRNPAQPVESVYAELGRGNGGPDADHRENPIYEGVEARRRTSPPQTTKDLVTSGLLKNTAYQYGASEVKVWCATVYGNENALNEKLFEILNDPSKGRDILQKLMEDPESPGKLAGHKALGVRSPARKAAEDGFQPLCDALERHVRTAKKLHKALTREHSQDKGIEKGQESLERGHHHHHDRHQRQGREHESPQQERHHRGREQSGMAFAM